MENGARNITEIIKPQYVIEGAGVLLRRSFGPNISNLFDPFLLFDHFAFKDVGDSFNATMRVGRKTDNRTFQWIIEGEMIE